MTSPSRLETLLLWQIRAVQLPEPEREYRWHDTRRWRFDFAWPERLLAVEVEGGVYNRGRHVRPVGFEADCEKYNVAALAGWTVLRFPGSWVDDGSALNMLEEALNGS